MKHNRRYQIPPLRLRQGFTLLEVSIAIAVLSVGIIAVIGIQGLVVSGNTSGNVVSQQLNLAHRLMEQFKNTADITGLGKKTTLADVDQEGEPGGPYDAEITVVSVPGDTGGVARFIRVTITRTGGVGGHPLTLSCVSRGDGT